MLLKKRPAEAQPISAAASGSQARVTFASLLRGGVEAVAGVNSRWLRTAKYLARNAGETAAQYVAGWRDRFSHPVAYAVASVTAYVLMRRFTTPEGSLSLMFDAVLAWSAWWAYLAIPLLAPAAFVLSGLFKRAARTAAESYVLILYVAAQIALVETAWTLALYMGAPSVLVWPLRLLQGAYALSAITAFADDRRWHAWLRAALVLAAGAGAYFGVMWFYVWQVLRLFLS